MIKVSDEQIEMLVRALQQTDAANNGSLSKLVHDGESIGFYHGLISGLVLSHQLLFSLAKDKNEQNKQLAQLLSLAAARASEYYLKIKQCNDESFPELLEFD